MGKDTKKTTKKGNGGDKNSKVPQLEDFFTTFLAKKVRNISKKLTHIKELEGLKHDELKKDQLEMLARKEELLKQIEENSEIKNLYLEAYSKKGELEAQLEKEQAGEKAQPEASKQNDNKAQLASVAKETEDKTVIRVTDVLSKLLLATQLLRTSSACGQFAEASGMNKTDLEAFVDFRSQFLAKKGNNCDHQVSIAKKMRDYVNQESVRGTDSKSMLELYNLVESMTSSSKFSDFVHQVEEKQVVIENKPVARKASGKKTDVKVAVRKESANRKGSEANERRSRKESKEQQDLFMEDDSEEDHAVWTPKAPEKVELKEEKPNKAVVHNGSEAKKEAKQVTKKETKKTNEDGDDEEWHTAVRGPKPADQQGNYRGSRGRGGRGRGGRGRGGNGERRERKEGEEEGKPYDGEKRVYNGEKKPYNGERRPYRNYDGEKKPYDGERRPYTKDGERVEGENRGGRGRGEGRGRGNYRGGDRGGRRFNSNKDGEERVYRQQKPTEATGNEEQKPLKEVGTLDRPQATNDVAAE